MAGLNAALKAMIRRRPASPVIFICRFGNTPLSAFSSKPFARASPARMSFQPTSPSLDRIVICEASDSLLCSTEMCRDSAIALLDVSKLTESRSRTVKALKRNLNCVFKATAISSADENQQPSNTCIVASSARSSNLVAACPTRND